MANDFKITIAHAHEHAKRLNSLISSIDDIATRELATKMLKLAHFLEGEVKQRTPVVTGVLRSSVYAEVNTQGVSVEGMISTPIEYGPPVEFGRKANENGTGGFSGRKMFQNAWSDNLAEIEIRLVDMQVHVSSELLKQL